MDVTFPARESGSPIDFDPPTLGVENKFDDRGYEKIKASTGVAKWTFFSDVEREVESARRTKMKGYLVVRDDEGETSEANVIHDFEDILSLVE